jgi:putative endonuclease
VNTKQYRLIRHSRAGGNLDHVNATPMQPCVYMLTSHRNGTLYIGVTSDLIKRVWQHKQDVMVGFTNKYQVHQLVWYEVHATMESAIAREKALKKWNRIWKIRIIEQFNPEWQDLYEQLT